MAARVKMLESKVATVEAQLQKRIDSDSDAKASQSLLAAKVQALEAKVADLEARPPPWHPKLKCLIRECL